MCLYKFFHLFQLQLKHAVTIAEVNQLKEKVSFQRILLLVGFIVGWFVVGVFFVLFLMATDFMRNRLNLFMPQALSTLCYARQIFLS